MKITYYEHRKDEYPQGTSPVYETYRVQVARKPIKFLGFYIKYVVIAIKNTLRMEFTSNWTKTLKNTRSITKLDLPLCRGPLH